MKGSKKTKPKKREKAIKHKAKKNSDKKAIKEK
jgi:hypothetical protein